MINSQSLILTTPRASRDGDFPEGFQNCRLADSQVTSKTPLQVTQRLPVTFLWLCLDSRRWDIFATDTSAPVLLRKFALTGC